MQVRVERISGRRLEIAARGVTTVVDRLAEDGGPGDGFRSGELLLGALGSCMLGTMLTFAENQKIDVGNVSVELRPVVEEHPERIARIDIAMRIEGDVTDRELQSLKRVAERCKITNTLHAGAETRLTLESGPSGTGSDRRDHQ